MIAPLPLPLHPDIRNHIERKACALAEGSIAADDQSVDAACAGRILATLDAVVAERDAIAQERDLWRAKAERARSRAKVAAPPSDEPKEIKASYGAP